ncbi:Chitinase 2 [Myotisia sp. PD_48]|nr:Chitinase 2 [Myotisia sp. PD_48]
MHLPTILSSLGLMAGAMASTVPHSVISRQAPVGQNVVYWGQGSGKGDLSLYCTEAAGVDVVVLAFLYQWGRGVKRPSGVIGPLCYISPQGQPQNCEPLAAQIAKCQQAGVKVILSLGGATSSYTLESRAEAEEIGQYLWDSYGNSGNNNVPHPFGKAFVNGWDFDIEVPYGSPYYQYMIEAIRRNFASDPANTYYITGAPQCPIPEPNMGEMISKSKFDWLFVQFYNNNNYTVPCSLPFNGNAPFNYHNWTNFISSTPSKDAKIFIGVPASKLAANGNTSGATYYITPAQLSTLIREYKTDSHFGGIMMWEAGYSDKNVVNGCTYAQNGKRILTTGSPC